MRRLALAVTLVLLASIASAQTLTVTSSASQPPATLTLTATNVPAGALVSFYVNNAPIGTVTTPPYLLTWQATQVGDYNPRAVSTVTTQATTSTPFEAAPITLVAPPPPPPVPLPPPPPTWSFAASPASLMAGASSVLAFTAATGNLHNVFINGVRPGTDGGYSCTATSCAGTLVVKPTTTATYRFASTNNLGTAWPAMSVTVTVTAAPAPPPTTTPPPPAPVPPPTSSTALIQSSHLVYEGSCSFPKGDVNGTRFGYGVTALAFNRESGSLYAVGHDQHQKATEFTLCALRDARTSGLAPVVRVQGFFDPTDGKFSQIGTRDMAKVGGILPWGERLIVSIFHYYDATASQSRSHVVSGRDLSVTTDTLGAFKVGTLKAGYTSGYMTPIPEPWRTALGGPALTGNCCIPIISRTSYGPAVFTFEPLDVGVKDPVPATPLLYYPPENPLAAWDATSPLFNGTTTMGGVVFPEGTRSVLFFGRHGIGKFCYGTTCFEGAGQGNHAPPYVSQVWAYDAQDLAAVRAGTKTPWSVRPYATWTFQFPVNPGYVYVGGVAYDPATQRIFLVQKNGEDPLLHVYRVTLQLQ